VINKKNPQLCKYVDCVYIIITITPQETQVQTVCSSATYLATAARTFSRVPIFMQFWVINSSRLTY